MTYTPHELLVGAIADFCILKDSLTTSLELEERTAALDQEITGGISSIKVLASLVNNCTACELEKCAEAVVLYSCVHGNAFVLVKEVALQTAGIQLSLDLPAASPFKTILSEYIKITIEPWIGEVLCTVRR